MKHALLASMLLFVIPGLGCGREGPSDLSSAPPAETVVVQPAPAGQQQIPLTIAGWDEVQEMVAAAEGKVVVIDVWSTWCVPCVREFPRFVELHRKLGESVQCISVNVNYTGGEDTTPESLRDEVLAFLEKREATFPNVICSDADLELYEKIDVAAVPVVFVYDKQGELRQRFDNDREEYGEEGFSYEAHILPLVERLLQE